MWSLGVFLAILMFLSPSTKCQAEAALMTDPSSPLTSDAVSNEPIKIKMLATPPVSKKHTRTRQNSRFLRTFPPVELLNMARQSARDNEISPVMGFNNFNRNSVSYGDYGNYENYGNYGNYGGQMNHYPTKARIDAGNSPIFYIKLPPVPYVFMPGVGYVSPHPYSSNSQSMPMPFSSGSGMMPGMDSFMPMGQQQESSAESSQSVISLPLKFLSNGRPHQIESPKRKKRPGIGNKENSSESKKTNLISGGNYHFNGRPTAVFVVRSPAKSIEKK